MHEGLKISLLLIACQMKAFLRAISFFLVACALLQGCMQAYNPPIRSSNLKYLVVDGIIINGQDSTIIKLSRTQNITDSNFVPAPESGAQCTIIGQQGESFPLIEQSSGRYVIAGLNLNLNETYQLRINTTDGDQFLSDPTPVKQTPGIDSVSWIKNASTIGFYVTTHDPSGNTRYYRWQYDETWEYNAKYYSNLIYQNGMISIRTPAQNIYTCWNNQNSTSILVGTSEALSQDLIYQQELFADSLMINIYPVNIPLYIPEVSQKFSVIYSLLVNQYAITQAAFTYWNNLKQNTEGLGTIFSPQPSSQVPGNIHCLTNPAEPVIGYLTASNLQQARIFVTYSNLFEGSLLSPQIGCFQHQISLDSLDYYFSNPALFTPVTFKYKDSGVLEGIIGAPTYCANCEVSGGINVKPSFWPN